MATVRTSQNEKIIGVKKWGGLNENPDGDTKLKMGEAAIMRNWTITRDSNLKRRPGSKSIANLGGKVNGMWSGNIRGKDYFVAAANGKLWVIWSEDSPDVVNKEVGTLDTSNEVYFFGFNRDLYILNGKEYYVFDGTSLTPVVGYVPLVAIAVPPEGGGELQEKVNRLSAKRRLWISPDGKGQEFILPEKNIVSVDYVKALRTEEIMPVEKYTVDLAKASVKFTEVLTQSTNSYEIGYTASKDFRTQVSSMRFGELYNGTQDARIFLYGDGSNRAIYSGLDYNGIPRADYFPDLNDINIGSANTPITGMIRHYSVLMCFKTDGAWSINSGLITLDTGLQTPAFYSIPTNRTIGNEALGQVRLVLNSPVTLHGSDLYEWRNNASYASNLSVDERQAKRISDRIFKTLGEFKLEDCICYDDNYNQEYYICYGNRALVHNYAADAWYVYEGYEASCMLSVKNELFFGTKDGHVEHMSYDYLSDDGRDIDAYWESGSIDFGIDYMRKYSAQLWVGIKPDSHGEVWVTVQTDRKSSYIEKQIMSSLATFSKANFRKWSFATNRKPQMYRLKIKAKKYVFYKIIFRSRSHDTTATILAADIRVRTTGYAK